MQQIFDSQFKQENEGLNISAGPMNISEIVDSSNKSYRGEKVEGVKIARRTRLGRKNKESAATIDYI